jgi:adenine-specific DNA-methyltransferase
MRGCINQRYFIKAPDNSLIIPPGENFPLKSGDGEQIAPANKNDKVWRWSQKRYLQERENLIFKETKRSPLVNEKGIQSKWSVYTRQYLDEDSGSLPRDFISDFENSQGTAALKKLGLEFSFAKPVGLISHLIEITNKKDPLVLDFFAGSGTTGQAVIELNALDNGNRRFILVTNNEENICTEVCYPRIKKIMKGYVDKTGQKTLGLGGSLRYFRTDFVEKSNNLDETKMRVAEHCKDLIRIREDSFQEFQPSTPEYSIYTKENSAFAFYCTFEPSKLLELRDIFLDVAVEQRRLYLFAFDDDNLDNEIFDTWSGVQIEPFPQKLIEILGSIDV